MRIWLRELRNKKGLTQEEVAEKAEISRPFYVQIENMTNNKGVSPHTAKKIASVLSFDWTYFFEEESYVNRGNLAIK